MPANLNQFTRGDERFDVAFERRAVVARNLEDLEQFAHRGGMVNPLAHEREDLLACQRGWGQCVCFGSDQAESPVTTSNFLRRELTNWGASSWVESCSSSLMM